MKAKTFSVNSWNSYAQSYDSLLLLKPYRTLCKTISNLVDSDKKNLIMDIGCGTGNVIKQLLNKNYENVIGVDNAPDMLDLAKVKCPSPYARFTQTDLNKKFPFKKEVCDVAISSNVLYAILKPQLYLKEVHRILTHKGKLILVTPKSGYDNGMILKAHCNSKLSDNFWTKPHSSREREEKLLRKALSQESEDAIQKMLLVAKHNREIATNSTFNFFDKDELEQLVTNSGFKIDYTGETYANQAILLIATKIHEVKNEIS